MKIENPKSEERGFALILTMIVLVVAVLIVATAAFRVTSESRMADIHRDTVEAMYYAESGLSATQAGLSLSRGGNPDANFTNILRGPDGTRSTGDDGTAYMNATNAWVSLANVRISKGTYTVRIEDNDDDDTNGDGVITAADVQDRFSDVDRIIFVMSTGVGPDAQRKRLRVAMNRRQFDLPDPPGGITLLNRGPGTNANFSGNAFQVDGRDYDINGAATGDPPVFGIATDNNQAVTDVVTDLNRPPVATGNVVGAGGATPDVHNYSGTTDFDIDDFVSMVNTLNPYADRVLGTPGGSVSVSGNQTWGTPNNPQVTQLYGSATINGNISGAGILMVEGSLTLRGNVTWVGVVIVTGSALVDLRGSIDVVGAMIAGNPSGRLDGSTDLDIRGSGSVRFSRDAIDMAQTSTQVNQMRGWMEL